MPIATGAGSDAEPAGPGGRASCWPPRTGSSPSSSHGARWRAARPVSTSSAGGSGTWGLLAPVPSGLREFAAPFLQDLYGRRWQPSISQSVTVSRRFTLIGYPGMRRCPSSATPACGCHCTPPAWARVGAPKARWRRCSPPTRRAQQTVRGGLGGEPAPFWPSVDAAPTGCFADVDQPSLPWPR